MANPRVYSIFHVKSVNEDQRIITGIATTPETDRMGDIVEPRGAQFKLPIPLLWQHNSDQPIGEVTAARVTDAGIEVTAKFAQIDEPGALHDRLTEAWQSVKAGLVKGLSIGFQSIESTRIEGTYGMRFVKWLWLELSCVTIPANADASILAIKSAASGTAPRDHQPGVSGGTRVVSMRTDTPHMKSYADQIKTWENTRAAKAARQDEIQQKALGEGRAKDEAEKQEFDTLTSELKSIDAELVDLHALETREAQAAVVVKGTTEREGLQARTGARITVSRDLPKGFLFARYAICMAASRGIPGEAIRLAKEHYKDDPGVLALVEKTAVAGGATSGSHYLDDMVPYNVMNDFIEYLRPGSIIGKFGGANPGAPGRSYPEPEPRRL
jgi:HK97 family phage prohead protease